MADSPCPRMSGIRERVARALYENTGAQLTPWDDISLQRKSGWLSDADVVIPIIVQACIRVVEQLDPEKPTNYLFRRENISAALLALSGVEESDKWVCPLNVEGCDFDCGNYGCGN